MKLKNDTNLEGTLNTESVKPSMGCKLEQKRLHKRLLILKRQVCVNRFFGFITKIQCQVILAKQVDKLCFHNPVLLYY